MKSLEEIIQTQKDIYVIDSTIEYKNYVAFDLSSKHTDALNLDLTDAAKFEAFVENHLEKTN